MKDRFLVRIFKVKNVLEYPQGKDDIVEQTEDQLISTGDFYCQMQGDTLAEVGQQLIKK